MKRETCIAGLGKGETCPTRSGKWGTLPTGLDEGRKKDCRVL